MSSVNLLSAIVTSCLTVLSAVGVLVLGQIITRFYIDPLHDLRRLIGEIADLLSFYANVYANPKTCPKEEMDKASDVLRAKATMLRVRAHALPGYKCFVRCRLVPDKKAVWEASRKLIALSNMVYRGDGQENTKLAEEIREFLRLPGEHEW